MPSHTDLLQSMDKVRAALISRYKWFIHTSPELNIRGIRNDGLQPRIDATAPPEVREIFSLKKVPILCLHPLGAKLCPRGASSNVVLQLGARNPKNVSFAVEACDLPRRVCLDWSYSWDLVETFISANPETSIEELTLHIASKYGSIASYDKIGPEKLRVFCADNPPANPLSWPSLSCTSDSRIVRHD